MSRNRPSSAFDNSDDENDEVWSPTQHLPGSWPKDDIPPSNSRKTSKKSPETSRNAQTSRENPRQDTEHTEDVFQHILTSKTHYAVLSLNNNATTAEIRTSYLKLSRRVHPDRNPTRQRQATEAFKKLAKAYEVLSNSSSRSSYDYSLRFGYGDDQDSTDFQHSESTYNHAYESLFQDLSGTISAILSNFFPDPRALETLLQGFLNPETMDEEFQANLLKLSDLVTQWNRMTWQDFGGMLRVGTEMYSLVMRMSQKTSTCSSPVDDLD